MKTFLNEGHDDRAAEVKFYFYDACRVKIWITVNSSGS